MTGNPSAATATKAQIREVIELYFCSLDRGDFGALAACFTPDVRATYQKDRPEERTNIGRDSLVRQLTENAQHRSSSIHSISNIDIDLEGIGATAVVHAVAMLANADMVVVRGLRYEDRLVKLETAWLIAERMHVPLWQYDVPRTPLTGSKPLPSRR